ncbi:protein D3 [Halyomorpha halys]|uniref:protein D3 n=1 Tax=Halyomorpha halys TaxID=286706 RepID=UPI0006D50EDE|nr:protein D3 [Halyomorpha halys]
MFEFVFPRSALLVAVLISVARASDSRLSAMEKHQVVPDVLPTVPSSVLSVNYPDHKVDLGNELTPTIVKDEPTVTWDADPNSFYTLCMTDPDAPSRATPKAREWHHWLVVNIPGSEVKKGEVLSAYIGSAPPKGTGLHRYVFVVYKQPKKLEFDEPRLPNNSPKNRANFSIAKFASKYDLGKPIAGNFYQAAWDEYSDEVHKRLA